MLRVAELVLLTTLFAGSAVAAAPADIRDIRGPLPPGAEPPFVMTAILLVLLAVVLWTSRRRPGMPPAPVPEARADARSALARLVAAHRDGACPREQLWNRLEEIIRTALATSTGMSARGRTVTELRRDAAAHLDDGTRAMLTEVLSLCELAKFACRGASPAEIESVLATAERLVDDLAKGHRA